MDGARVEGKDEDGAAEARKLVAKLLFNALQANRVAPGTRGSHPPPHR